MPGCIATAAPDAANIYIYALHITTLTVHPQGFMLLLDVHPLESDVDYKVFYTQSSL